MIEFSVTKNGESIDLLLMTYDTHGTDWYPMEGIWSFVNMSAGFIYHKRYESLFDAIYDLYLSFLDTKIESVSISRCSSRTSCSSDILKPAIDKGLFGTDIISDNTGTNKIRIWYANINGNIYFISDTSNNQWLWLYRKILLVQNLPDQDIMIRALICTMFNIQCGEMR